MHEVIVARVDGSKGGYAAVAEAAELATRFGARLIALSEEVFETGPLRTETHR